MDELDYAVESLEAVPEAARSFYVEANGQYVLAVKGVVPEATHKEVKSHLDEFRTNNRALLKEQAKLKALASIIGEDGLDPDKLQSKINTLAEARVQEMKTTYETQVTELTTKYGQTAAQLENLVLTDAITKAALKNGVVESALTDVVNRARSTFVVKDGKLTAANDVKNRKGEALSVEDWVSTLAESAPHFFGTTSGAGATKPSGQGVQPVLSTHEKLSAALGKLRK